MSSKADEVAWGTSAEVRIIDRWVKNSPSAKKHNVRHFMKLGSHADFDFILFNSEWMACGYAEVKRRRSRLDRFGDCIFPKRKYDLAVKDYAAHRLPVWGVTEYGCGALAEVLIFQPPAEFIDIKRHDRPGTDPVPHCVYTKAQVKVVDR